MLPWKFFFLTMLISGSLIAMSASSWLIAWIGLEVNLLAFLAITLHSSSPRNSESILKYFLIQALASSFLIASALSSFSNTSYFFSLMIFLALMLKLGAAPLHFWVPQILSGCSWVNTFLILTWQKAAPFILIASLLEHMKSTQWVLFSFIILSTLIGALGGLTQSSLSKILAFSSINHMGWMLMALTLKLSKWALYFFSYSIILFSLVNLTKIFNIISLSSTPYLPSFYKESFFISLLSFGGLPPFFGFLPKWAILDLISSVSPALAIILVMGSLLTLFFYLRVSLSALLNKSFIVSHQPAPTLSSVLLGVNIFGLTLIILC